MNVDFGSERINNKSMNLLRHEQSLYLFRLNLHLYRQIQLEFV